MYRMIFAVAFLLMSAELVSAQGPFINQTVQLPTVRTFSINTVVSVPDGGTMYLSGNPYGSDAPRSRSAVRSRNRSVGSPGASVSATLVIGAEVDAKLDRRSRIALARKMPAKIHGTAQEKAKASFLAKHLGRGWK